MARDITTIKACKDGSLTIKVPNSQVEIFRWILSEGEAGLALIEGPVNFDKDDWNGWVQINRS